MAAGTTFRVRVCNSLDKTIATFDSDGESDDGTNYGELLPFNVSCSIIAAQIS